MPIGKNALKRVENNGYSNVKSTAPDMENSVVVEEVPVEKKPVAKKPATKKSPATKAAAPSKKTVESVPAPLVFQSERNNRQVFPYPF